MDIAVYSGSFNPLHIGHKAVMEALTLKEGFDLVYLVVSPKNPLKDDISADSGKRRYLAAVEAVKRHHSLKVRVDDIELQLPPPQYTIRTLEALKDREPGNSFTLVIGADNLAGFRRWRSYRRILTDFGIVVYPRSGFDAGALRDSLMGECRRAHSKRYRIRIMDAPAVDVSSTMIRDGMAAGKDMSHLMM